MKVTAFVGSPRRNARAYADMESGDAYIFASPAYFDHVTAQFNACALR